MQTGMGMGIGMRMGMGTRKTTKVMVGISTMILRMMMTWRMMSAGSGGDGQGLELSRQSAFGEVVGGRTRGELGIRGRLKAKLNKMRGHRGRTRQARVGGSLPGGCSVVVEISRGGKSIPRKSFFYV